MKIFQTDITAEDCFADVECSVTVATLIFVLSAIHPEKFRKWVVLHTSARLLHLYTIAARSLETFNLL